MKEFSIESAMGFDTSKSSSSKRNSGYHFLINDDRIKVLAESVENADTINTYQMLQERNREDKRRMITKLNRFSENYLVNHKTEKHSVESYLNNCLLSMERDSAISGLGVVQNLNKMAFDFPSFVATAIKGNTSCGEFEKLKIF